MWVLIYPVKGRRKGRKGPACEEVEQRSRPHAEAIVAAAADHIRRAGIAEASLADVMAAAGLTHGGFYRHFRNKEQLVAEALSDAGDKTVEIIGRAMSKGGLNAAVDSYLSAAHRDARTPTCPFAALGASMPVWPGGQGCGDADF